MTQEVDFSVMVILGRGELEPCLPSLLKQEYPNYEIIAVVGSESEKNPKLERVRWLVVEENNPALRRNRALEIARGRYLAFIDDDARAEANWLKKAKAIWESHPDWAGFGGVNLAPAEQSWREELVDLILSDHLFGSGSRAYQSGATPHLARPGEVHLSNFFILREVLKKLGGFNEKLGYGGEDSELVYLVKKVLGEEIWFVPELWVWHQRRKFGWSYLVRNFRFRRQNGRMLWVYPGIYLWNFSLWLGLAGSILLIFLLAFSPKIFFYLVIIYWLFFSLWGLFRLKRRKWLFLFSGLVYFFHHLSYLVGLWLGLLEGLFLGRKRMEKKLGRENLEEKRADDNI